MIHQTSYPHIVKADGICGGQAVIKGTRIAVWHIVGYYYKVGMSVEDILAEWSYLQPAQIFSALAYYHDHQQEIDNMREQNRYDNREMGLLNTLAPKDLKNQIRWLNEFR